MNTIKRWIIKNDIIQLTGTGILVICIAMFGLRVFELVNISLWFILPPMAVVIICVVIAAYE